MKRFFARVVLHQSNATEYRLLHGEMATRGFMKSITTDDGREYQMPDGEYIIETTLTRFQVIERAKQAASANGFSFDVLVLEVVGALQYGLDPETDDSAS